MTCLAGSFLVARPVLQDASFRRSVVLVLQHGEDGAFGLIVNRKAKVKGLPFAVFAGGPCDSDGLFMLHGHAEWIEADGEVAPGIYLGDAISAQRVSEPPEGQEYRFRMFNGYAGWGPKQLEVELAAGAWAVVPASGELLFETPISDLWATLLPPSLPEFSVN